MVYFYICALFAVLCAVGHTALAGAALKQEKSSGAWTALAGGVALLVLSLLPFAVHRNEMILAAAVVMAVVQGMDGVAFAVRKVGGRTAAPFAAAAVQLILLLLCLWPGL